MQDRLKVMHVAECIGGVDRYIRSLLRYSSCENIMILSQLYNEADYRKLADNVEVMNMKHTIGISGIVEALKLRRIIKKYNPDIVYAHSSIAGAITRMASIGLKPKIIYNPHGWSFNMESKKKKVFVFLEKIMSHFCDVIVCISEAEKETALRKGICREEKLYVIYNGIDITEYKKKEDSLSVPRDSYIVGMVGRICRQKSPDIFVKMASEVQKKISNVKFVIVGDVIEGEEAERKEIESLAESLNVELLITGWVDNPLNYMEEFDVGCLLSRWEGFGLVIPEYMLTETVIVANRVDAIPYLIRDGKEGYLVEKDNWQDAADKVILLLENAETRHKMIKNNERVVRERFDIRRVAEESEKLYKWINSTKNIYL